MKQGETGVVDGNRFNDWIRFRILSLMQCVFRPMAVERNEERGTGMSEGRFQLSGFYVCDNCASSGTHNVPFLYHGFHLESDRLQTNIENKIALAPDTKAKKNHAGR